MNEPDFIRTIKLILINDLLDDYGAGPRPEGAELEGIIDDVKRIIPWLATNSSIIAELKAQGLIADTVVH